MGILIIDVGHETENRFRQIVQKRFGSGDHIVEVVVNKLMEKWIENQAID